MDSDFEAAYREYYREVELHWSWRREKQIIVSPVEFEMIESWHDADVPLAVVLRAIDLFVEAKSKAKRKRSYLLTHVDGTVKKVLEEYRLLHIDQDGDADLLGGKLRKLTRKLSRIAKTIPEAEGPLVQVAGKLKAIDVQAAVSFETVEQELENLDLALMQALKALLSQDEWAAIRAEAEEVLKEEEDPAFFAKIMDDGIRFHFGLPRLTVLG